MAIHAYSSSYEDEDYIDIELFSSANFVCYPITSPSPTRDFEFKMSPFPLGDKPSRISPADELFFNGKLLPLHIPPRLQMLQNLIQDPSLDTSFLLPTKFSGLPAEISVGNPLVKPNDCLIKFSASCFINYHPLKKSNWTDKLKPSLLARKIKASTSYLKYLFTKSGDEFSCTRPAASSIVQRKQAVSCSNRDYFDNLRYMKVSNKCPFKVHGDSSHRRKSKSIMSSSSSSTFSFSSSNDLAVLKRSGSSAIGSREIENSIEGAIAYCKKSYQQLSCSTEGEVKLVTVISCS